MIDDFQSDDQVPISQIAIIQCSQGQESSQNQIYTSIHQAWSTINVAYKKSAKTVNQLATNIVFNAKHSSIPYVQRKPIVLQQKGQPVFLLGHKYEYCQNQQFLERFRGIIWVTYRPDVEGKTGDAGWGCMIRVCQMTLAEALKQCHKKLHASEIINQISQSYKALFSFDRICSKGHLSQRWASSTQILSILKQMLAQQNKYKLGIEIFSSTVSTEDAQETTNVYPLLVCINNRLGQTGLLKQYTDSLLHILQNQLLIGLIAGVGNQANFIVGHHQKNLISLDPHYVQSQQNGQGVYFRKTPRGFPIEKIMPSLCFCFLVKNRQQHKKLIEQIAISYHFHYPYSAIEFDKQSAKKIYQNYHKGEDSEQQFQVL